MQDGRQLLERIAAGDGAAMRELIDRYGDLLWSLARRVTRTESEAEDAVQDIVVYLWQRAPRYKPSLGEEATFVSVLARRRLIDRLRRDSRRPVTGPMAEEPASAGEHGINSEEARIARSIYETLNEEQKSVIRLSVVLGRTHELIAEQTGLPLGTVKTHIRRGLAQIRERLMNRTEGRR